MCVCVRSVIQLCLTLCDPMNSSPGDSSVHGTLQAGILERAAIPSSRPSFWPRIEPASPALRADSLTSEPPGKPMNTRIGSPSLLQGSFWTQESNWGLLHCKQILYQLSYQWSPVLYPRGIINTSWVMSESAWNTLYFIGSQNTHILTSPDLGCIPPSVGYYNRSWLGDCWVVVIVPKAMNLVFIPGVFKDWV